MFNQSKQEGFVLVRNFQSRLLLAISAFVGILLLTGWVMINEPARMEVFTQQYAGRSIENGATIFLNNCALCHGVDGKGNKGVAPALNNPMMFLKENPAKAVAAKITDLQTQIDTAKGDVDQNQKNVDRIKAINQELANPKPDTDKNKLNDELNSLQSKVQSFDLNASQSKVNDLTADLNAQKAQLDKLKAQGWDPNREPRLKELGWAGTLPGYLESTVISGRPLSALYWPRPMPAWGQQAGGPLRADEIKNVVDYLMNFQDTAVKLTPNDVREQLPVVTSGAGAAAPKGDTVGVNADIKKLSADGKLKPGDAAAGEQLYTSLGCAGCHLAGQVGPKTDGTFTRINNDRLKDPANAGKTAEEYIAESIIHPSAYVVPNFPDGVMTKDFGAKLTLTDLQNLIAFLETKK